MARMNREQLEEYFDARNFNQQARELVRGIRGSCLGREADYSTWDGYADGQSADSAEEPPCTAGFESKLASQLLLMMEYDPNTHEVWTQPPVLEYRYTSPQGWSGRRLVKPDIFRIAADGAGWEEWLDDAELASRAETVPGSYVCSDGSWRCPAGEDYAAQYGLYYRVRSSSEVNRVLSRNLEFLADYFRGGHNFLDEALASRIEDLVQACQGIRLSHLLKVVELAEGAAARGDVSDTVFAMLASRRLHTDLQSSRLTAPGEVRIYTDKLSAGMPRVHVDAGGFKKGRSTLMAIDLVRSISRKDARSDKRSHGNLLPQMAHPGLSAQDADRPPSVERLDSPGSSQASLRFPEQSFADLEGGSSPEGSGPSTDTDRPAYDATALLHAFVEGRYKIHPQLAAGSVYKDYTQACADLGLRPAKYSLFRRVLKQHPAYGRDALRGGREGRSSGILYYADYLSETNQGSSVRRSARPHGQYPLETVEIDCTILDEGHPTRKARFNASRPWLLVAVCPVLGAVARVRSHKRPNHRSVISLLRRVLRRYGRLPSRIVLDSGIDCRSTKLERFLARHQCVLETRPAGRMSYRAVTERHFAALNKELSRGYRSDSAPRVPRHIRADKSHPMDPKPATDDSSIEAAWPGGTHVEGNQGDTLSTYEGSEELDGLTATTVKVRRDGIRVRGLHYWSQALSSLQVRGTSVSVRYNPSHAGSVFVLVDGLWMRCYLLRAAG